MGSDDFGRAGEMVDVLVLGGGAIMALGAAVSYGFYRVIWPHALLILPELTPVQMLVGSWLGGGIIVSKLTNTPLLEALGASSIVTAAGSAIWALGLPTIPTWLWIAGAVVTGFAGGAAAFASGSTLGIVGTLVALGGTVCSSVLKRSLGDRAGAPSKKNKQ